MGFGCPMGLFNVLTFGEYTKALFRQPSRCLYCCLQDPKQKHQKDHHQDLSQVPLGVLYSMAVVYTSVPKNMA